MLSAPNPHAQCHVYAMVRLAGKALRKLVMQKRAKSVAWNPMEAFNFTAASEDCNLYSYDMRKLASATCVHQVLACGRTPGAGHLLPIGSGTAPESAAAWCLLATVLSEHSRRQAWQHCQQPVARNSSAGRRMARWRAAGGGH